MFAGYSAALITPSIPGTDEAGNWGVTGVGAGEGAGMGVDDGGIEVGEGAGVVTGAGGFGATGRLAGVVTDAGAGVPQAPRVRLVSMSASRIKVVTNRVDITGTSISLPRNADETILIHLAWYSMS